MPKCWVSILYDWGDSGLILASTDAPDVLAIHVVGLPDIEFTAVKFQDVKVALLVRNWLVNMDWNLNTTSAIPTEITTRQIMKYLFESVAFIAFEYFVGVE